MKSFSQKSKADYTHFENRKSARIGYAAMPSTFLLKIKPSLKGNIKVPTNEDFLAVFCEPPEAASLSLKCAL